MTLCFNIAFFLAASRQKVILNVYTVGKGKDIEYMKKGKSLIKCAVCSDTGNYRRNNEDNYYVAGKFKEDNTLDYDEYKVEYALTEDEATLICAIFDGMGGLEAGEVASLLAAKTLSYYENKSLQQCINEYFKRANDAIAKLEDRTGTTATIIEFSLDGITIGNIGDSRAYLYYPAEIKSKKSSRILQLTKDDTRAQYLIDSGILEPEQAKGNGFINVLTQHLGMPEDEMIINPEITKRFRYKRRDIFLLCSDGISDVLSNEELRKLLDSSKRCSPINICRKIAEEAKAAGSKDNMTVLVAKVCSAK